MKIINLLGNEYQGSIGKSVTASKWKGRNYLKKWFKPTNPNSKRQQDVRKLMKDAVGLWHGFTVAKKGAYYWYQRYRKTNISPFNAMVGSYVYLKNAVGLDWTTPPATLIVVKNDTPAAIEGAKVIVRKKGQATDYLIEYSDSEGNCPSAVCDEDKNYDIFITATGYVPYSQQDLTPAEVCTTHTLTAV